MYARSISSEISDISDKKPLSSSFRDISTALTPAVESRQTKNERADKNRTLDAGSTLELPFRANVTATLFIFMNRSAHKRERRKMNRASLAKVDHANGNISARGLLSALVYFMRPADPFLFDKRRSARRDQRGWDEFYVSQSDNGALRKRFWASLLVEASRRCHKPSHRQRGDNPNIHHRERLSPARLSNKRCCRLTHCHWAQTTFISNFVSSCKKASRGDYWQPTTIVVNNTKMT